MGPRINPHGLRIGVIKDWEPCEEWYDEDWIKAIKSSNSLSRIGKIIDWDSRITVAKSERKFHSFICAKIKWYKIAIMHKIKKRWMLFKRKVLA